MKHNKADLVSHLRPSPTAATTPPAHGWPVCTHDVPKFSFSPRVELLK